MGTTESVKVFIENAEIPWQEVDKGVKRKIMAYDERLMVVKVVFDKGELVHCISILIPRSPMLKAVYLK